MSSLEFMDIWKCAKLLEMLLNKLREQNWLLSNQLNPSNCFQKFLSHKYFYEKYGGGRKKEMISIKGNCRASIGGRVCPTHMRGGHQKAKHQNRSTMKKNIIEQQWLKYLEGTVLYAKGSEWKINLPPKEPLVQVWFALLKENTAILLPP